MLPLAEVELQVSRSSGPGGQHAQKSETRVVAVFDVEASSALTDVQKRRVITRAGPVLRAVAQDERSQTRNRELALERLVAALREALRVRAEARPDEADRRGPRAPPREKKRRAPDVKRLRRELGLGHLSAARRSHVRAAAGSGGRGRTRPTGSARSPGGG